MAFKMKTIRERLNDVAADKNKFHPVQQGVSLTDKKKETKETGAFAPAIKVGREGDKRAIKELLKEPSNKKNVSIIPIIGIGGVGKTTLAQLVYDDEADFNLKMWVWVSTVFDVKTLIEKVIKAATKKECPNLEMDQLQSLLRENLDGKKYLLVLDDVWNTDHGRWTELKDLLMGGARGSMILVTTRGRDVARMMGNIGSSHELRGLSEDDSRSLFKQVAFEAGQMEENPGLLAVGEEILKKCGGIPLAIRTVAGLLFVMDTETEWLNVKNQLWKLAQEENDILPTLRVSYERLPSHLKKCFAYCSLFPKGSYFEKETLIQLWMAQGFIQPSKNRLLEDIGDEYFKILWRRSFFQDAKVDGYGNVITFEMHDLMHDLAQSVAGLEYFTVNDGAVDISERVIHASVDGYKIPISLVNARKLRTLLRASTEDFDKLASTFKCLRVLSCWGYDVRTLPNSMGELKRLRYLDLSESHIETLPNSVCELQNLQTLILSDCSFTELPREIKKLVSLRHLDLSSSGIELLPNSVCELQNLQTLKLTDCYSLTELPRDIKKLVSLRHLENYGCWDSGMPSGFGQLTSIQTLPLFVLGSGGLSDLEGLNNLRGQLEIIDLEDARNATSESGEKKYLKEKKYLLKLRLIWITDEYHRFTQGGSEDDWFMHGESEYEGASTFDPNGDEDAALLGSLQPNPNLKGLYISGYRGVSFPDWMFDMGKSLPNLVEITLSYCPSCECFPLFDQLRFLKVLKLKFLESLEHIGSYIGDSSSSFKSNVLSGAGEWFPALKEVYLCYLPKLKEWSREVVVVNDGGKAKTEAVAEQGKQLLSLNSLAKLSIKNCPELKSMPLHPYVKELKLDSVSEALIQSMTVAATASLSRETFTSPDMQRTLKGKELDLSEEEDDLQGFRNLHSLQLRRLPKLTSLPKGLQHATALKDLKIRHCPGLMNLPHWFGNLTSLRKLTISDCDKLKSLPEGMCCFTSLQELTIYKCHYLSETCRKETGEDWRKIAHIPVVYIY